MQAASAEEVGAWLADRQFYVVDIKESVLASLSGANQRIAPLSSREMNYLLLQLSSLLNAGCPLLQSVQALHRQSPPGSLRDLLKDIKEKIEAGKAFSESLKAHPQVFSSLFITMVEVGEVGGILDLVMERYSEIFDAMFRIRGNIIKSMIYPAILVILTVISTYVLSVHVIPSFLAQVIESGRELPFPTRVVLALSSVFHGRTVLLLGLLIGLGIGVSAMFKRGIGFVTLSRTLLACPVLGILVAHMQLALFARILGTLLRCGVPILTSLAAVERALGNAVFKEALSDIRAGVARGESLSSTMSRHRHLFPDSMILMVDVGERSGTTGNMLDKAAIIYERDLENAIQAAIALIQPMIVIFMACIIVFLAMAMYLPIFDISKYMR